MGLFGGGGDVDNVDEVYNAGMLNIANTQMGWAQEYYDWMWGRKNPGSGSYSNDPSWNITQHTGPMPTSNTSDKGTEGGGAGLGQGDGDLGATGDDGGALGGALGPAGGMGGGNDGIGDGVYKKPGTDADVRMIQDSSGQVYDDSSGTATLATGANSGGDGYWMVDGKYFNSEADAQAYYDANVPQTWQSDPFEGTSYMDLQGQYIDANAEMLPGQTALTIAQNQSAYDLLPGQTALGIAENEAALGLLPQQTDLKSGLIGEQLENLENRAPVNEAFYEQSLEGIDAEAAAARAKADASHAFVGVEGAMRRENARLGISPRAGRMQSMKTNRLMEKAKAMGTASSQARRNAEQENYDRLTLASGAGGMGNTGGVQ